MRLTFPEDKIPQLAADYKLGLLEPAVIGMRYSVLLQGCLSRDQLYKVARWKSARSAEHVLKNSDEFIREVTRFALSTANERARIEVLTVIDGVLWPTASVLLHLYHVDPYPILDFRALESVGEKVPNQYSFSFWWEYVQYCRKLALKRGIEMRELDRALWQHSVNVKSEA